MRKKANKKDRIIILGILLVAVVVAGAVALLQPRVTMHEKLKELVEECKTGDVVTDFSSYTENTFTISNDYFSVEIPEEYVQDTGAANPMLDLYQSGEKSMVIFKEPSQLQMSLINPQDKNCIGGDVEPKELSKMVAKLGYGTPDCYYNIMKAAILLDKEDYNLWDKDKQIAFAVMANIKKNIYVGRQLWNYERGEVCAIVSQYEGTQNYVVDVAKAKELKKTFSLYLNNVEEEEVWKLLNSLKFY